MTPTSSVSFSFYPSVHKPAQSKLPVHHSSQLSAISRGTKCNCGKKMTVCVARCAKARCLVLNIVHPGTVKALVQRADERGSDQGSHQCIKRRLTLQKSCTVPVGIRLMALKTADVIQRAMFHFSNQLI